MNSSFFNAELVDATYDRTYNASDFARYFKQFVSNGVYADTSSALQVVTDNSMNVRISTGACFIEGYMGYIEDTYETVAISASTGLPRIDRVVARLDLDNRKIDIQVIKGTSASTPVAPDLTRAGGIYDLCLANITVGANIATITTSAIEDTRGNGTLCGYCAGIIEQLDLSTATNQYTAMWQEWFETIKGKLSEDQATNLYNMIQTVQSNVDNMVTVPIGAVQQFAGSTAPDKYLMCDGTAYSRTTYATLFNTIGTTYGSGDGSTTFNVPNLQGRVIVGQNASDTDTTNSFATLGATGGEKTHQLTIAEMPSHTHTQNAHKHLIGAQNITYSGSYLASTSYGKTDGTNVPRYSQSVTATNQNTGGNGAHNNVQPYIVMNYIIRAL